MRAVQVLGSIDAPKVTFTQDMSKPEPKDGQILLKVHAAGITGDEVTWPEVYENPTRIPGCEVTGTIEAIGPSYIGSLSVGDEVWALLDPHRGRGQAEYTICMSNEVTAKPISLSFAEAAVLPIPVLTAWQMICEKAKMVRGAKVLITGASGAVGRILVQLARGLLDAEVTALAASRHRASLLELGVKEVLDYHDASWAASATGFDYVFDTVGGDVLSKTWETVKPNGTIITVGPPQTWVIQQRQPDELKTQPEVKCEYFIVWPDAQSLAKVAELVDSGIIKAMAVREFAIEQAAEGWSFGQQRNRNAKSVVTF